MAYNPLFIIPDFFFHFHNVLCHGYLRFERKWENSFGKVMKMEGKEKALEGKITKYPVVPSEARTHDLLLTREKA